MPGLQGLVFTRVESPLNASVFMTRTYMTSWLSQPCKEVGKALTLESAKGRSCPDASPLLHILLGCLVEPQAHRCVTGQR